MSLESSIYISIYLACFLNLFNYKIYMLNTTRRIINLSILYILYMFCRIIFCLYSVYYIYMILSHIYIKIKTNLIIYNLLYTLPKKSFIFSKWYPPANRPMSKTKVTKSAS